MDEVNTSSSRLRSTPVIEKSAISAFLDKLFVILEDESIQDIISWQLDGNSFIIKKPTELEEIVLPKYFKHNNIQSFVRQLNMYSFSKTKHDSNFREFKQSKFMKGRRDLLHLIKRKQSIPTPTTTVTDKNKFKIEQYDEHSQLYNYNQPILSTSSTSSSSSLFFNSPLTKNLNINDRFDLNTKKQDGEILELHEKVTVLEYKLFNLKKKYENLDYKYSSICEIISNTSNDDNSKDYNSNIITLKLKVDAIINDKSIVYNNWEESNNNSNTNIIKRDRKMSNGSENTDSDNCSDVDVSDVKHHHRAYTIDTNINDNINYIELENNQSRINSNETNGYCFPSSSNALVRMISADSYHGYESKKGLYAITSAAISLQNNFSKSSSNKSNLMKFSSVDRYLYNIKNYIYFNIIIILIIILIIIRAAYNLHSLATIMELSEKKSPMTTPKTPKRTIHEVDSKSYLIPTKIDNNVDTNIDNKEEQLGRILKKSYSLPYY
jgi:hypothetical protein